MDIDLRATVVGFALAAVVLAGVLSLVGIGRVTEAIVAADLATLAAVLGVAVCWLSAWGLALHTVLSGLGSSVRRHVAVLVFAAATFANNVTPFGQAGGEPVAALFVSRAGDTEYETGLAAIASVDSLNFVPSILLASGGIAYFSTRVAFGDRLRFASYAVGALALAVPVLAVVGWRYRYRVEGAAIRAVTPVVRFLGRVVPGRMPPARDAIRSRVEGFFHAIERVTGDRRRLALALGFSTLGWLCLATSLWLSLAALGEAVAYPVVLVVVPVGAIAGITPLPGGLGGVEAVLIALLAALGVPAGAAAAAVVVHRLGTYVLPTVVGGGVAGVLGSNRFTSSG
ncbi:lysylphosphatidylglycerol synthase transmembrane domain-containing protein [Halosegnis marinus]|uniref:YbhN family protein n=1 Tax=Halosegnis marinus TaxID=3034023 RepID=A0ABD5ZPM1_9EURY|nr:lysylphosphatidylglycerol synthase transmembrane domain-containing protein [Halosegnis sp. DT85]